MKVLLVRPPTARRSFSELGLRQEPVAHAILGAALKEAGHEVRFVDLRRARSIPDELGDFRPEAAAVGVIPATLGALDGVLDELVRSYRGISVLLFPDGEYGTTHVVERPEDFFHPMAEALSAEYFLNELVHVVPDVMNAWEEKRPLAEVPGLWVAGEDGEWEATEPRPKRPGDFGVPDRSLFGRWRGSYAFSGVSDMAFVFTSYGCKFRCRYCPMSKWGGGLEERSVDHIVEELLSLEEANVFLADYEPLQAPEHLARIASELESRGVRKRYALMTRADSVLENEALLRRWKELGLTWVYLGLDGHSPDRLREIRKGASGDTYELALRSLTEMGLKVSVGFLVRSDFTQEDFRDVRRYVKHLNPPAVGFTVETPLVGTTLFDDEEARITTRDWSLYDLQHAVLPTKLPLAKFYRELVKLHLFGLLHSSRSAILGGALPFRDQIRNGLVVARRLPELWFGARHHRAAPTA